MAIAAIRAPAGDRRASASRARLAEADRHLDRDPGPLVDAEPARGQQRRTTLGADRRSAADKAGKRSPHRRRRPVLPPTFLTALTAPARGVVLEWANAPAANQLPVRVPALLGKFSAVSAPRGSETQDQRRPRLPRSAPCHVPRPMLPLIALILLATAAAATAAPSPRRTLTGQVTHVRDGALGVGGMPVRRNGVAAPEVSSRQARGVRRRAHAGDRRCVARLVSWRRTHVSPREMPTRFSGAGCPTRASE